jgi:hypothetical protein
LLTLAAPRVAEADEYLRLKALVIVYTNTFAGSASSDAVENIRREVDEAVEFIWRSSRMRLHLAVDDLTVHEYVPEDQFLQPKPGKYVMPFWTLKGTYGSVAVDLENLGYASGSYDLVVNFYAFEPGPGRRNYSGARSYGVNKLLDKAGFVTIPMSWSAKTFNGYVEHEFLHILKDIFRHNGDSEFPLMHNGDLYQFIHGESASYDGWVLGSFSDSKYFDAAGRWGTLETFKDRDGDGVPDYSPHGDELSITELTLGSSTSSVDTDDDGLSDLEEATAGIRSGTDPNNPDTDGDGLIDGSDPDPLGASEAEAQ